MHRKFSTMTSSASMEVRSFEMMTEPIIEHDESFPNEYRDPINEKCNQILECLQENESSNLWTLREMALTRGGLCNAELRQQIWPELVGLREDEPWMEETTKLFEPPSLDEDSVDVVCSESEDRERDLIRRDVGRSVLFHHSCPSPVSVVSSSMDGDASSPAASVKSSSNPEFTTSILAAVLTATVSVPLTPNQDRPHYYQGLHDIGGMILKTMDFDQTTTTAILRRLCRSHLRDAVRENFSDLTWFLNSFLLTVLEKLDPHVHECLVLSGVPLISTVLPWIITWFTHCLHEEEVSGRMIDAFMAAHPLLPFYVSVALLVHPNFRMDILTAELDDPSSMHFAVQNLPARIRADWTIEGGDENEMFITAQELIDTALTIMEKIPPRALLDLLDAPTDSRCQILERASHVALMKAPSSWTVDGSVFASPVNCARAKVASGVNVLMCTNPHENTGEDWRRPFGPPPVIQQHAKAPSKRKAILRTIRQKVRLFVRIFFSPHTPEEADRPLFRLRKYNGLAMLLVSLLASTIYGFTDFATFFFFYVVSFIYNPEAFFKLQQSTYNETDELDIPEN